MTLTQFLIENPKQTIVTVRWKKKNYLCTSIEALQYFGDHDVKRVGTWVDNSTPRVTIA